VQTVSALAPRLVIEAALARWMMHRVLLLEDEAPLRRSLGRLLSREDTCAILEAGFLKDAVHLLDEPPQLIISDLDLPDGTGLDLLSEITSRGLKVPVIVITAHLSRFGPQLASITNVDVLEKPVDSEELVALVRRRLSGDSGAPRSAFTVADYLQLAGLARRNVRLAITTAGGARGEIVVQDGQTTWAQDQLGVGVAAFRRLALLPRAEVVCKPADAVIAEPNLHGSLEQMLLEAARTQDEAKKALASKTSAQGPSPTDDLFSINPDSIQPPDSAGATQAVPANSSPNDQQAPRSAAMPPRPPPRAAPSGVAPESGRSPANTAARAALETGPKEKPMNMMKPIKPMLSLDKLVTQQNALSGAARARKDGSVLDVAGEIDGETTCAVVTVASRHIEELAAELGLGDVSGWHLSMGKTTWYVANSVDEMVVGLGGPNKNPTATLNRVQESFGRRP
jgi:DNA-binding response OmpR family regulator